VIVGKLYKVLSRGLKQSDIIQKVSKIVDISSTLFYIPNRYFHFLSFTL